MSLFIRLSEKGMKRIHQGKVRDTYALPDPDLLLVVATNRISIFDFVLPALVARKGELLTAMTVFWLTEVLTSIKHHLVAFGKAMDQHLPPEIRGLPELYGCSLVVEKQTMTPVECIVRGYLTGSGWESYQKDGHVCGIQLPAGLHDGARIIPAPIFTPTTKAKVGHDEHLLTEAVTAQYGAVLGARSLTVYQQLAEVAEKKGLILADTKFEFGERSVLADEVGTPDSSRFWDYEEWLRACEKRQSPPPFDKQLVRNWGKEFGIDKMDPRSMRDLAIVDDLRVPDDVLAETTRRYEVVLQRLTDKSLDQFQKKYNMAA